MPRLIGLVLVFFAGLGLIAWAARQAARQPGGAGTGSGSGSDSGKTYRPKSARDTSHAGQASAKNRSASEPFVMPSGSTASLRDALTGAPIDEQAAVWRCLRCQSLYNEPSVRALAQDNGGKCVLCTSLHRSLVVFAEAEQG